MKTNRLFISNYNLIFLSKYREFMVFNATFNNISVILRWSVLSVEETGVPRKYHRPGHFGETFITHLNTYMYMYTIIFNCPYLIDILYTAQLRQKMQYVGYNNIIIVYIRLKCLNDNFLGMFIEIMSLSVYI